jgi:hypothetical protein
MGVKSSLVYVVKTIGRGMLLGVGICLVALPAAYLYKTDTVSKVVSYAIPQKGAQELEVQPLEEANTPSNPLMNLAKNEYIKIPQSYSVHEVNNSEKLIRAMAKIKKQGGNAAIILADGTYQTRKGLTISVPNVMILSKSNDPRKVVIKGRGMRKADRVENIIKVNASGFVLSGVTLRNAGNHLIQIAAERNADIPVIRNCILQDAFEQIIKVSYDKDKHEVFSDSGLIEYCLFEYTAGIGPNYYIGGVDAHGIRNWVIRNNVFKDIASPTKRIAEHAIHLWNNTSGNIVEGNVIIDSDRAIGFGMRKKKRHRNIRYSNYAGLIKDNIIYHGNNGDKSADTGIILEDSPLTKVEGNTIFLAHDYPRAIEYRFPPTNKVLIKANKTNKSISSRNGGEAELSDNSEALELGEFLHVLDTRLKQLDLIQL